MTTRERNIVWRLFTAPAYRQLLVDWEGHARQVLAEFRATCGRYPGDPRLTELIQDLLLHSPEFRAWWPAHEVLGAEERHRTFNHPEAGYLLFNHLSFQVLDTPDLKVCVSSPGPGRYPGQTCPTPLGASECPKRVLSTVPRVARSLLSRPGRAWLFREQAHCS